MLLCSTVKPLRVSLVEPVAYLRDSYGRSLERNELSYEAATESKDDPAARRRLLTVGQVATAAMIEQSLR